MEKLKQLQMLKKLMYEGAITKKEFFDKVCVILENSGKQSGKDEPKNRFHFESLHFDLPSGYKLNTFYPLYEILKISLYQKEEDMTTDFEDDPRPDGIYVEGGLAFDEQLEKCYDELDEAIFDDVESRALMNSEESVYIFFDEYFYDILLCDILLKDTKGEDNDCYKISIEGSITHEELDELIDSLIIK